MSNSRFTIREIRIDDNEKIARVIRSVLIEYGVPKKGTAYDDTALDSMYETYNKDNCSYFIVCDNKIVVGGAGIMKLNATDTNVCELQKMYFLPGARGQGLGSSMMEICLQKAKLFGFKKCYLETLPYMVHARKLYEKEGFVSLDGPMGQTGHYNCNMWMIKNIE